MQKHEFFIEQYSYGEVEFEKGKRGEGHFFVLIPELEDILMESLPEGISRKDCFDYFSFSTLNIVYNDENIMVIPIIRNDMEQSLALWSQIDFSLMAILKFEHKIWLVDDNDHKVLLNLEHIKE
jgi:hypothetical protein